VAARKKKRERRIGGPLRGFGPEEVGREGVGSGWAERERGDVESFFFF
jgi:hypothetical protein